MIINFDLKRILKKRVKCIEQASHERKLIITELPSCSQENLVNVFESMCKVIKSKANISNIEDIFRVPAADKDHSSPIILRFTHPKSRDEFIASKIEKRKSPGTQEIDPNLNNNTVKVNSIIQKIFITF